MLHRLEFSKGVFIVNDSMLEMIDKKIKESIKKDNSMFLVDLEAGKDMFRVHYNDVPTYADINSQWSNFDIKNRMRQDYYNQVMNSSIYKSDDV